MRKTQDGLRRGYTSRAEYTQHCDLHSCILYVVAYQRKCTSTCTTLCRHSTSRSSKGKPARMVYYWVYMAMNSS